MVLESIDRATPKYNAWFFFIFPVGIGLRHVLLISASKSDSYHIFKAPAAPDPIATANKDIIEVENETLEGEISSPTAHVNKTKDITLGFIKLKKDCKFIARLSLAFLDFVNIWLNLFYFRQLFKCMKWRW